ncbi:MAG: hypothetical protein ACOYIO_00075 [Eubacteriales bacterium]
MTAKKSTEGWAFLYAARRQKMLRKQQRYSRRAAEGFKFVCAKLLFGCADSRLGEPRYSLPRERIVTFCAVQKVTKKHAGLRPATSIQIAGRYVIVAKVTGIHQVTGNAKNSSFPGIAGNDLNRCDTLALQHKIRANSKRMAVFFADSRLREVEMGGGGGEKSCFGWEKGKVCAKENFWFAEKANFFSSCKAIR